MTQKTEFLLNIFDKHYTPESITLDYSDEDDLGGTTLLFELDEIDYTHLKLDLPYITQALEILKPTGIDFIRLALMESYDLSREKRVFGFVAKGF